MSLSPPCTCPCSFFGDLAGHSTAAVLERLFQLEGEGVLQDMLSAVEAQEGGSWRRVIRVLEEPPPPRVVAVVLEEMEQASEGMEQGSTPLGPMPENLPSTTVMSDTLGLGRDLAAPVFTRMSQPEAAGSSDSGHKLPPGSSPPGSSLRSTAEAASAPSALGKLRSLLSIRRPAPDVEHIVAPRSPGESDTDYLRLARSVLVVG